jgi:hypothetical protein
MFFLRDPVALFNSDSVGYGFTALFLNMCWPVGVTSCGSAWSTVEAAPCRTSITSRAPWPRSRLPTCAGRRFRQANLFSNKKTQVADLHVDLHCSKFPYLLIYAVKFSNRCAYDLYKLNRKRFTSFKTFPFGT